MDAVSCGVGDIKYFEIFKDHHIIIISVASLFLLLLAAKGEEGGRKDGKMKGRVAHVVVQYFVFASYIIFVTFYECLCLPTIFLSCIFRRNKSNKTDRVRLLSRVLFSNEFTYIFVFELSTDKK